MNLFDDFERIDIQPSGFSEPYFDYWNKTARHSFTYLRNMVENWCAEINADQRKLDNLRLEFRSADDRTHLSAFFETYLHHLFHVMGFKIEVEPILESGRKPDFLVTHHSGKQFYLEATANYPDSIFGTAKKQENIILDEINQRVKSKDFYIHLSLWDVPTSNPPFAKIADFLNKELARLDADELIANISNSSQDGFELLPTKRWQNESWTAEFKISPKKPESRNKENQRVVGIISHDIRYIDDVSSIRSRIDNKYGRYGELDIPYVLAMNVFGEALRIDHVIEALYGDERVGVINGEVREFRKANGSWRDVSGWQKKRMSAVLVFFEMYPHMFSIKEPLLLPHPQAKNPIDSDIFPLSQLIYNPIKSLLELKNGIPIHAILGSDATQLRQMLDTEFANS